MAQMVGDGPNRGQSAPSPRKLPKMQAAPERTVADAIGGGKGNGFSDRPLERVEKFDWNSIRRPGVTHPPALAPRSADAVRLYNKPIQDAAENKAQSDRVSNMYQAMADRQRKLDLRTEREKKDRTESGQALTADQWANLSPLQQAAVQANADLASAVARDFRDQGKHTANSSQGPDGTARIQEYMRQVKDKFGEDGSVGYKGLEFAPNTMAFLNERGLDASKLGGKTLDDLVSGDALFTMDQIDALGKPDAKGADVFQKQDPNIAFAENVARGQMQYQEDLAAKLAKGNQLLTGMTGRATNDAAGRAFGAAQEQTPRLDAVQPQTLQQIDLYMEALARPDSPIDKALGAINLDLQQRGVSEKEAAQVWEELSNRARVGATGEGGGKWFDGLDYPMRSPQEVAQALGAPTLKRRQTTGG